MKEEAMNLNQHKATIALAILSAACGAFLPYFPHISAGLAASTMGFLGTVTALVKTYQTIPGETPAPSVKP